MNDTAKEIVGILDDGRPELQVAAAQVLGELKLKDPAVVRSLDAAIGRSNVVGRYALEALAKIATPEAQRIVARALWEHDGLQDQASYLLAEMGPAVHASLAEAFEQAAPEKRSRFLAVLARSPSKDSIPVFQRALLTPELGDAAVRHVVAMADKMAPAVQKLLREGLTKHLDTPLPDACVANLLTVLGRVDAANARATIIRYCASQHPHEVRAAAFRALQGSKLTAPQVKSFLDLLEDPSQRDVHDAVRDLLGSLAEWPEGLAGVLKRLLAARQPEQRLFALRALRSAGGVEMAKVAIRYLDHADPRFRDAAAAALAANKQAIEPLARLLQTTKVPAAARTYSDILVRLKSHFAPRLAKALAEKAVKLMPNNQFAGDHLFDVAVAVGRDHTVPLLLEKAVRLRRARRYAEALHVLAKLAHTNGVQLGLEGRYQLALTKLLHDLGRPSIDPSLPGNATMGFFAALVRDGFPLLERLRKEGALEPDALLRLASYFAEAVGPERRFGADLLQHLASRNKGRTGEEAKLVLRAVGL